MMTIKDVWNALPESEEMQPEGKMVSEDYQNYGITNNHTNCLYLISFMLHELNIRGVTLAPRKRG